MGIKYKVNENYFSKWGYGMAYLLGYLYADGSMEDASYLRGKYLRATSTDESIILSLKKLLDSEHKIIPLPAKNKASKIRYFIRIGSHKLYDSLINRGLRPHKSLTMNFPRIPHKYIGNFVRGYFDGDGCVYIQFNKNRSRIEKLSVIFTSGSKIFLEKMGSVLKDSCQLKHNKVYNSHKSYQLRYSTTDSIKIFNLLYKNASIGLYLERKLKIFIKYFKLSKVNQDEKISKIISKLENGLVVK